ncbi:DdrH [Deinococcus sp.]|uniref:DdrH n=1 Tax=Deinococcus sp. TaxID=47478 RepID=UPI0025BAF0CE|nr:DdrH [Deinococcus sp.]
MTANAPTNPYAEWFEQLRAEYGDQLSAMPLPDGLPEYLHQLVQTGDEEAIKFMLRLAWQLGAQVGYAAGSRQGEQVSVMRPDHLKA